MYETRGSKRIKTPPLMYSARKRAYRALARPPTRKGRKDILCILGMYKSIYLRHGGDRKHNAWNNWIDKLTAYDKLYYMEKAMAKCRTKKIKGDDNTAKLVNILTLLKAGEVVDGFTILRSCKTEKHPIYESVLTGEDLNKEELLALDLSLCVKRKG